MPIPQFGGFPDEDATQQELLDHVIMLQRAVEYHLSGRLDTTNAYEFGGWYIGKDAIASKNMRVGLSSATDGSGVRIWAGTAAYDAAPFRVYEDGRLIATNGYFTGDVVASNISGSTITGGTITGALIRTGPEGTNRLELAGGIFTGKNEFNQICGLYLDSANFTDMYLYSAGNALLKFNADVLGYRLYNPLPSGTGFLQLGHPSLGHVSARGAWNFSGASVDFSGAGYITGIPTSAVSGLDYTLSNHESRISSLEARPIYTPPPPTGG